MKQTLHFSLSILAMSAALSFQGCDKLKNAIKTPDVHFTGASADITIPPTNDTTAQAAIGTTTFSYNIDSMIQSASGGLVAFKNISSIKITSMTFTLLDGTSTNNFANFAYAGGEFNTGAVDSHGNSYGPYTIAYVANNPDSYNLTFSPPITDASQDVKKYFTSNTTFVYLVVAKLRRPITTTLHCHVDITYDIAF